MKHGYYLKAELDGMLFIKMVSYHSFKINEQRNDM